LKAYRRQRQPVEVYAQIDEALLQLTRRHVACGRWHTLSQWPQGVARVEGLAANETVPRCCEHGVDGVLQQDKAAHIDVFDRLITFPYQFALNLRIGRIKGRMLALVAWSRSAISRRRRTNTQS
jgi:hypothetical protein